METTDNKFVSILQRKRKVILLLTLVIIALVTVISILRSLPKQNQGLDNNQGTGNSQSFNPDQGNCQSEPVAKFGAEFTDLSKINAIGPIGGIGGGSPGRSYIGVLKGVEAPIYAPADATLENIVYARRGGPSTPGEYGLYIRLSCNETILFDHIDRVSDRIKAKAPPVPADTSRTNFDPVNLDIKKGELLGYTDGTPQARTFDFLLIDKSKPATHINPKRWEWEQAVYAQCPYDYFVPQLKEKYYAKIGEVAEISGVPSFTPAENCGDLSHDIEGTISGGWFKGESTDNKGDYLAIAREGKRVDISQKKDGLFPDGVGSGESKIRDYSTKTFPENVKVGEDVCYHDRDQGLWVYFKLIADKQLSVARGSGSCQSSFPESLSESWER